MCLYIGLFQKKSKQWSWGHTFLRRTLGIFWFSLYSWKVKTKWSFPQQIPQNTHWNFQSQTPRPHGNSLWPFMTLGNSTSLLIDPWNFCTLFLQCPWKFHVLSLPCLDFSAISHSCSHSYISDYWLYLVTGRYCTRKVHMNIMKNENVVNNGRDKKIFSWGETRFYRCIVLLCLLWNFRSWFWSLLTKKII